MAKKIFNKTTEGLNEALEHDKSAPSYVVLPDDIVRIVKGDNGRLQYERNLKQEDRAEPGIVYPQTEKLRAKLEAEVAAGKARIAAAEERRKVNVPTPKSEAEVKAEGSTVAVFRPGDFREYAKNFKQQASTRSKDM